MIRRSIGILLLVLLVALPAAAQTDSRARWDLSNTFTVTNFGFQFNYPANWIYAIDEGQIYFAEEQSTLDTAIAKAADTTTPPFFNMSAIPLSALRENLGEDVTIDQIADFAAVQGEITETEPRVDIPVMARRSVSLIGTNSSGRAGFGTLWTQDEYLFLFSLSAPDMPMLIDLAFSWGQVLGSARPVEPLELSDTVIQMTDFAVNIPVGWFPRPDAQNFVFELESDIDSEKAAQGYLIIGYEEELEGIGLTAEATSAEYATANETYYALLEGVQREEILVAGFPGVLLRGTDASGQWGLFANFVIDGKGVVVTIIAPDEEKIDAIKPTWVWMLQNAVASAQAK
ncbi:MAG: hypothetical protein JNJ61_19590 [Anaerolineae bacterium]|nr:hypothetical protein [Anaerolineae bacterium]